MKSSHKTNSKVLFFLILVFISIGVTAQKTRVIHTSDLKRDDTNTLIRMLLFANDQNIIGITSSASPWSGEDVIYKVFDKIDLYEKVYENLRLHDPSYPSPDYLRSITKAGNETATDYMEDTPGSLLIKDVLIDHSDDSPVWVTCWGAAGTVTAALRYINDNHPDEKEYVARKLKMFLVGNQEGDIKTYGTGVQPLLDYIVANYNPVPEMLSGMSYGYMNDWGNTRYWCDNVEYSTIEWVNKNYNKGHGDLCSAFVYYDSHDCDGDAMALLHILGSSFGLRSTERPEYGGWGTRFSPTIDTTKMYKDDTDYSDDHYAGKYVDGTWAQKLCYSGARWADDFQNELAVRADWCVKSYEEANHAPIVNLATAQNIYTIPGDTIYLTCNSTDPDGDLVSASWWQYIEAGTSHDSIDIIKFDTENAWFVCPSGIGENIHIILEVQDNNAYHPLTRYARVIVNIVSSTDNNPFHFYVATDVHMIKQRDDYTSSCFRNQILTDIKMDTAGVGKFVVVTGDMDPFFRTKESVEQVMGVDYRFYPVIGNHDVGYTNNDYAKFPDSNWCNVFDIVESNRKQLKNIVNWGPEIPTPGLNNLVYVDSLSGKEYYSTYDSLNVTGSKYTTYSFDEGNSHFVVLDIYAGLQYFDTRHMGRITNQLYDWLADDLAKTQKENIFVFAHQPVWKCKNAHDAVNVSIENYFKNRSGEFGADSLVWFEKEYTSKIKTREEFWNLLKENNVVAYFCGHTHRYTANKIDGVWEINLEFGAWQIEGRTRYGKIIVDKNKVELLVKGFIAEPKHFETIERILLKE